MTTPASEASLTYGRAVSTGLPFAEAVERTRVQLKEEGFGILCDIDVAATMREKLGESFRPYRILGACNPQLAHRALEAQPYLGLLLPCNLIVQESDGRTLVAAVDARAMLGVVGDPQLSALADEVNARLGRVLDAIANAS